MWCHSELHSWYDAFCMPFENINKWSNIFKNCLTALPGRERVHDLVSFWTPILKAKTSSFTAKVGLHMTKNQQSVQHLALNSNFLLNAPNMSFKTEFSDYLM